MICKEGLCKTVEKLKNSKHGNNLEVRHGQTIQFDAFVSNGFTLWLLRP